MSGTDFPDWVFVEAWLRSGGQCECTRSCAHHAWFDRCQSPLVPGDRELDHILPKALGGLPTLDNSKYLCKQCHDCKTYGDPAALEAALGRLLSGDREHLTPVFPPPPLSPLKAHLLRLQIENRRQIAGLTRLRAARKPTSLNAARAIGKGLEALAQERALARMMHR